MRVGCPGTSCAPREGGKQRVFVALLAASILARSPHTVRPDARSLERAPRRARRGPHPPPRQRPAATPTRRGAPARRAARCT
eukprot:365668-Chlamydomonas_euryale.AAC.5